MRKRHPGEVFGRLTLIRADGDPPRSGSHWVCLCLCGNECRVRSSNLSTGQTRSCGCLRIDTRRARPLIHPTHPSLWTTYRRNARIRGLDWELDKETFTNLVTNDCYYCGSPPCERTPKGKPPFIANGIDRVDNTQGYSTENCVPCCSTCNLAKGSMTTDEFIRWAKTLVTNLERK